MAEPVTIAKISVTAASFIKKYWYIILILLFIIALIPTLVLTIAINILFPQASKEEFKIYKALTEETEIHWASCMAYDVVRLDNYLKKTGQTNLFLIYGKLILKNMKLSKPRRK